MAEENDVIDSDSSSEDSQNQSQSSEGNNSLKGDEKYVELLKKKDKAIDDLRAKYDALVQDKEERIDELENKKKLSSSEEDELSSLQDQVAAIRRDKRSKPWLELNKTISKETTKEEINYLDLSYAEDHVEELAELEKSDLDTFYPKIKKFMRKVDPEGSMKLLPRVKKAYKLMKHEESLSKREQDIAEKEKKFQEIGGSRQSKSQTKEELMNWRNTNNPDANLSELLKGISDSQETLVKR